MKEMTAASSKDEFASGKSRANVARVSFWKSNKYCANVCGWCAKFTRASCKLSVVKMLSCQVNSANI